MSLLGELKRRNVIRVATAYVVAAWLVVQVVETVFPAFGFGNEAIRITFVVLEVGFVPVLVLSWFFELTPEGLKRDTEVAEAHRSDSTWLDRAIIIGLVIAVAYFAYDKFVLDPVRDDARETKAAETARLDAVKGFYGDRSIAVLPFVNASPDSEQAYFAEGISEEILGLLAQIRELRVISRSSSFRFTGRDLDIPDVARQLDVAHILEGSVRKAGNRVRVTAQLIEATTDTQLWSQSYDRELHDIFTIQDEIAADVAKNLKIALVNSLPHSRVTDPEVVALVAQAKLLLEIRPDRVGRDATELLERALAIDPDYVPALEWLGVAAFFVRIENGHDWQWYRRISADIDKRILAIEPANASVDYGQGWIAEHLDNDLELAAMLYSRAVTRNPADSNGVRLAGRFARDLGRFEQAIRLGEHAVAIDPLCFQCLYQLSRTLMYTGRFEEAKRVRERYLPLGSGGQYHYGLLLMLNGEAQAAQDYFTGSLPGLGRERSVAGSAMAEFALGNSEEANQLLQQLLSSDPLEEPVLLVDVYAWMDRKDEAFEIIEAFEINTDLLNPIYRNLFDDPRWTEMRDRMGYGKERLAAIEFNPQLPE
jgi:TolB-like protein